MDDGSPSAMRASFVGRDPVTNFAAPVPDRVLCWGFSYAEVTEYFRAMLNK